MRRVAVVMNDHSGNGEATATRDEIDSAFRALGVAVEFVDVADAAAVSAAAGAEPAFDAVVAAGGDGTINTVANALAAAAAANGGTAAPLGAIALGTFNYVARRYALGETIEEAVRTVVAGRTVAIAGGEVAGRLFLNNCSFGLYTSIIDARERHKGVFGRHRLVALLSAIATMLGRHARLRVRIVHDGGMRKLRASLVFVGANPLQLADVDADAARRVEDGALALVVVRAINLRRLLGFAWQALRGAVVEAPGIELEVLRSVTLVLRRRSVRVVLDGELLELTQPLEVRWRGDALRLRVPAAAPSVD